MSVALDGECPRPDGAAARDICVGEFAFGSVYFAGRGVVFRASRCVEPHMHTIPP